MSDFLLGGTYPTSIKLGNTSVQKLMMGTVQVWPRTILAGYGRLYNWWCTQLRSGGVSIAPVGWHVPTLSEWLSLSSLLGGNTVSGGHLKETGTIYWHTPNVGADNSSGFSARAEGFRSSDDGAFYVMTINSYYWSYDSTRDIGVVSSDDDFHVYTNDNKFGFSLRLIKNDSSWTIGDTLTDIDGNVYPTIKIGSQVWMGSNLKVTKYNDGTPIPNVTDNTIWVNLSTGAHCTYNNDDRYL